MKKIKAIIEKYRGGLVGKITLVASGTLIAQILGIICTPIITRLFTTAEYGVVSVYTSSISIIVMMSAFSIQKAIPIAKNDIEARKLVSLCFKILLFVVAVILGGCCIASYEKFELLSIEQLFSVRFALPIGVLFVGSYEILLQWTYRKRAYNLVPKTRISQAVFGNLIKIIAGYCGFGVIGLVSGVVVSQAAGLSSLLKRLINDFKGEKVEKISVPCSTLIKRYYRFPVFSLPADFLDNFANQIPIILLSGLYGSSVSGKYGLANTIISIPISLIVTSMSRVMYAEAANLGKDNAVEIKRLCIKLVKATTILIIIPCLILFVFGPQLFGFVFGKEWFDSGIYVRLMMGRTIAYCLVLPIGRMLDVFEQQYFDTAINLGRVLLLLVSVVYIKKYMVSGYLAVFIFNTINMLANMCLFVCIFCLISKQIKVNKEKES